MGIDDSEFMSFADDFEKKEAARNANRGGNSFTREYETLKWTGLEPNKMKIIRALGGVPNSPNADNFTARIVQVGWINGDNGKKFRCVLPLREANGEHIMWRVIARVNEVTYINRKRVYVNETKHPDIFDLVNFNGLPVDDKKRKFDKGWEGRQVIVMNVIDREQMDWHRENKHTMLLSRNVSLSADGTREYVDEGVPIYGFYDAIVKGLFKNYGNWEGYDMGIVRLGTTQQPYRIINASAFVAGKIPEVPASITPLVSLQGGLTEEEASWDRYDLAKIYGNTSFTKLYNNLKVSFQRIDATLGTKFTQELEFEVEKEKKERAERNANQQDDEQTGIIVQGATTTSLNTGVAPNGITQAPAYTTPTAPAAAPATRTRAAAPATTNTVKLTADKIAALKGWSQLSDAQQKMITDVTLDRSGKVADIKFDTDEGVLGCPQCRVPAPESFTVCPSCGFDFNAAQ